MKVKESKVYFEYMRIIAIVLVIFNHLPGYMLFSVRSGPMQFLYMMLTMFTRINVPLFLMISGALLLDREESYELVLKKRVSRFIQVILIFTLGLYLEYYILAMLKGGEYEFSLLKYMYMVFSKSLEQTGSYWYLYAYLGFLLALPLMQRVAKGMSKQDFWVLLLLHFVLESLIPLLNVILSMVGMNRISVTTDFSMPFVTLKCFFYPLLGYYLENFVDIKLMKKKYLWMLVIGAFLGMGVQCLCTFIYAYQSGDFTQSYVQLFDYITTIVAFIFIKRIVTVTIPKLSEGRAANIICKIGSLTFGMYLLDPYLKPILYTKYISKVEMYLPVLLQSIGWCLISMVLGGVITYGLKLIPSLKKLI